MSTAKQLQDGSRRRWERERQQRADGICAAITETRRAISALRSADSQPAIRDLGSALDFLRADLRAVLAEENPFR